MMRVSYRITEVNGWVIVTPIGKAENNEPLLERGLLQIGLRVRDIDMVISTHEHCDDIGANRYFHEHAVIAAYRLAASKK